MPRESTTRLNKTVVEQATYEKTGRAAQYLFDNKLTGFGLRIYPSGKKTFVVTFRTHANTKRFIKLGSFPETTVEQARALANGHLDAVRKGRDPQAELAEKRSEQTFDAFADWYLAHVEHRKKTSAKDSERLRLHIRPVIGKRKLSEITPAMLAKLHDNVRKLRSPATANRCAALLKHMFRLALDHRMLLASPSDTLKLFREPPPRDIVLTRDEVVAIFGACDADPSPYAGALFKLCALTGRRVGEWLALQWTDVDTERREVLFRDTKAGEPQRGYLSPEAASILRALPSIDGNPYVIAGAKPKAPLRDYKRAWKRILRRAGLPAMPVHGLRHNWVSTMVANGQQLDVVGHLVGHKSPLTTRKYLHHRPHTLHRVADEIDNVVSMDAARQQRVAVG